MRFSYLMILFVFAGCQKDLTHEKYVLNTSNDTVTVINPDFDSVYTILPGDQAKIYAFQVLDTKQESEACRWLGDTLIVVNESGLNCQRLVSVEENWSWTMEGPEKRRVQKCTFIIKNGDF